MAVATEEPVQEVACEMDLAGEKWDEHLKQLQTWVWDGHDLRLFGSWSFCMTLSFFGKVTPKSKTTVGSSQIWRFDQNRMNKSKVQVSNSLKRLHFNILQVDEMFSVKQVLLSFRKTFYDMWIVECNLISSFTGTNMIKYVQISHDFISSLKWSQFLKGIQDQACSALNVGSPRDASGHRRASSGSGGRKGFGRWKIGWPPEKIANMG